MAIGFGVLKLGAREFWSLTPVELEAALRGLYGSGRQIEITGRSQLNGLMCDFPDVPVS